MLRLNLKTGETVLIGGGIRVTVTAIHGGKVELGITAPKAVPIVRAELLDRALAKEVAKHGTA